MSPHKPEGENVNWTKHAEEEMLDRIEDAVGGMLDHKQALPLSVVAEASLRAIRDWASDNPGRVLQLLGAEPDYGASPEVPTSEGESQ